MDYSILYTYCCIYTYFLQHYCCCCVYKTNTEQVMVAHTHKNGYQRLYPQKWAWKYIQNLHTHFCGYVQTQPFIPTFVGMRYPNLFVVLKNKVKVRCSPHLVAQEFRCSVTALYNARFCKISARTLNNFLYKSHLYLFTNKLFVCTCIYKYQ